MIWHKLRFFSIKAAALWLLSALPAVADSPFQLEVETLKLSNTHLTMLVNLKVPPYHLIYAESLQVDGESLRLPEPETETDPFDSTRQVGVYKRNFSSIWRLPLTDEETFFSVAFQGCDQTTCFMPEQYNFKFERTGKKISRVAAPAGAGAAGASSAERDWLAGMSLSGGGGYMNSDDFLAFLARAEGKQVEREGGRLAGFLRDPVAFFHANGIFLTLLLVLLGGVLLNLTPCVLPMIPINLAILGAGGSNGRLRGFSLGSAYGCGIVLVYGGLGWLILQSGLFFGALQSSPWFSLVIAIIFTILTLSLFDFFVIDFNKVITPREGGSRQGVIAAFSAGALSALLAGACVAPVVLAVLLLAGSLYASGIGAAQFLPFVLGLGMALPWPLAGAGLAVLPKPGMWMERVKQGMGILLALLALYYFYLSYVGFRPTPPSAAGDSIVAGDYAAWQLKVAQARREGKPIFVDFWATWCKNCAVMEHRTFADEQVKQRLAEYVVIKVQAEKPDRMPAREMLEAFGVRGLPGFAVLR